jgi:hypothetical protein
VLCNDRISGHQGILIWPSAKWQPTFRFVSGVCCVGSQSQTVEPNQTLA